MSKQSWFSFSVVIAVVAGLAALAWSEALDGDIPLTGTVVSAQRVQ